MPYGLQAGDAIVLVLAAIAAVLFIHFLFQYLARGLQLRAELRALSRRVRALAKTPQTELRKALSAVIQ